MMKKLLLPYGCPAALSDGTIAASCAGVKLTVKACGVETLVPAPTFTVPKVAAPAQVGATLTPAVTPAGKLLQVAAMALRVPVPVKPTIGGAGVAIVVTTPPVPTFKVKTLGATLAT